MKFCCSSVFLASEFCESTLSIHRHSVATLLSAFQNTSFQITTQHLNLCRLKTCCHISSVWFSYGCATLNVVNCVKQINAKTKSARWLEKKKAFQGLHSTYTKTWHFKAAESSNVRRVGVMLLPAPIQRGLRWPLRGHFGSVYGTESYVLLVCFKTPLHWRMDTEPFKSCCARSFP